MEYLFIYENASIDCDKWIWQVVMQYIFVSIKEITIQQNIETLYTYKKKQTELR